MASANKNNLEIPTSPQAQTSLTLRTMSVEVREMIYELLIVLYEEERKKDKTAKLLFHKALRGDEKLHSEFMEVYNRVAIMEGAFCADGSLEDKRLIVTSHEARSQIRNLVLK